MNFYRKLTMFLFMVLLLGLPGYAEVADKIVAVVNDEIITLYEYNAAFEPYLQNIEKSYKGNDKDSFIMQTKEAFLQKLIDSLLIEQEAKKKGISDTVKEDDVMAVIQDMLTKQNISMQDFLKNLAADGSSIETLKKEIRSQMIRMRLLKREIRDKIIITDEEIGAYYDKHRQEYEGKESVRMKQLFLAVPDGADKNARLKIKNEAVRLRERIMKGESFDTLAAQYSKGPAAVHGGDVGFIEKGTILPEVETAAFRLSVGKVSEVIQSDLGFHIIKVVDKKGAGLKPIAMVREEIKAKLEDGKLETKYDEWISSVRAKSHIDIRF